MSQYLRPPIVLLKEGTDQSQGVPQIVSNINACQVIGDIVRTTLGPRGMDKLIYSDSGVTITNDGATVMKLLNVVHPAAKIMVEISKAQDNEVGDGTTSVVVLAVEFLKAAKNFLEEQMSPVVLIRGYRRALSLALAKLNQVAVDVNLSGSGNRDVLVRCAETSLSSKLVSGHKRFFADIAVDAVSSVAGNSIVDLKMVGVKKVTGGSLADSQLIRGVAFKRPFTYAGAEQQPKHFQQGVCLVLCCSIELELKAEKDNAEVRISDPALYQSIVDAEWQIIYDKLDLIKNSGAQVVLSRLPIGDLATQYFADHGIFSAGRVEEGDLVRCSVVTGAKIMTTVSGVSDKQLGRAGAFEEIQIGGERWCKISALSTPTAGGACTVILRGGALQFIEETERSLHDAMMIVKRALLGGGKVVGGGGAIEMVLSKHLLHEAKKIAGAEQLVIEAYAKALEVVPRQLAVNSGADSVDIVTRLRALHEAESACCWMGVDCFGLDVQDAMDKFVWEPVIVRRNALSAATEAACLVLSIDETVKNPQSEKPQTGMAGRGGRGRGGRGMRR